MLALCANAMGLPPMSRRALVSSVLALTTTATTITKAVASTGGMPKSKDATSVFVGTYTDPNHPGGTREVTLLNDKVGAYQLANVHGGGGYGEPASFDCPAFIVERPGKPASIMIDFSVNPKRGPKDFAGVWDKNGISFARDGNFWPKQ